MTESTVIEVKKGKIAEKVLIEGKFEDKGVLIKKWEAEKGTINFLADMKRANIEFLGVLNSNFDKDGYGIMRYPNGEKYFGIYTDDLRSKHGLYQFPEKKSEGNKIEREFFFGIFNEGKITERGVYLWIKEDKKAKRFNDFDSSSFSCFVGDLDDKSFKYGAYLTKEGDSYYVYYGGFNEKNEKEGNDVFYYCADKDELMLGTCVNNKYTDAYLAQFNDDGDLTNGIYATFDDEGKITSYKQKEEIPDKQKKFDEMFDFRNTIMGEDYFGEVFNTFKGVADYLDSDVTMKSFGSDDFPKLINVSFDFNKISIKEKIDSVIAKYEEEEN